MLNGLYSAAAGMLAQQDRMDLLANDIANVDTTGYKQQRVGFEDLIYNTQQGVRVGSGAAITSAGGDFTQGALQQVGNPLSLAISGPGFFQVRQPDGRIGLTRDGSFQLDGTGELVTSAGDRLVPPVRFPKGTDPGQVSISPAGAITSGATKIGQITLVTVPAPAGLTPIGGNLYQPGAASGSPRPIQGSNIQQGYLEASNVDLASAMVNAVDAQQGYSMDSRAIQIQDQMMQIADTIRQ